MIGLVFIPVIVEGVALLCVAGLALYAYWQLSNRGDFEKFDRLNGGLEGQQSVTWNGTFFNLPAAYRTWSKEERYQWYLDNVPRSSLHKDEYWLRRVWDFIQRFWWLLLLILILLRYGNKIR